MKLIEQFTQSKTGNDALNEDLILVTDDYCGILDGATSFTGLQLGGMPNGRFASQTLAEKIRQLPADISALDAVQQLSTRFHKAVQDAAQAAGVTLDTPESLPASAMLLYSRARKEIWRLADSPFMVDGIENQTDLPPIAPWVATRQIMIESLKADGVTEQHMLDAEPMADVWKILIPPSQVFANTDSPYAWGVMNGTPVPERLIEVHDVRNAKEIVLASDGYPKLFNTHAATEAELQRALKEDPLMYKIYPQVKGKKTGWVSFDDRAYLRFTP